MSDTEETTAEGLQAFQQIRLGGKEADIEEYTKSRQEEKEREAREIEELKRKREERKKERAEEEKRMAEQRKEEEARRKAEEEERKKKKAEEEERRRKEKERKRREAEKSKGPKTPNFTIVKKEGGGEAEDTEEQEQKSHQKSKEELEKAKQAVLQQRVTPLSLKDESSADELIELAKSLHDQIRTLVSNQYNLEEQYKRQQYDIVELQERARAMSKTKKKGVASVQYDDSYDRMNDRFANAPPKILVANKFEANLDRRSWKEKVDCYNTKEDLVDINKTYSMYIEFAGGF